MSMTANESATNLRNSTCMHNSPSHSVSCAADCNVCIADAIRDAERAAFAQAAEWHTGQVRIKDEMLSEWVSHAKSALIASAAQAHYESAERFRKLAEEHDDE